jgi:hypothetical protein
MSSERLQQEDAVGAALCGRPVSRRGRPHRGAPTFLILAALFSALGCGKQGPPLPPLKNIPAPTKDLTVVQQGPQLLASFTYPTVTAAGVALGGMSAVEIWTTARPAPDGKATPIDAHAFATAAKPLQKITGADLTAATSGSRMDLALPLPPLTAPVTPATGSAKAPAVPPAPKAPTAPAAPTAPTAPATTPAPGAPAAAAPGAPATPAGPLPLATYYAIRTFGRNGEKSDFSNIVTIVPTAPPAAPQQVTITARGDGIQVEWAPVTGTVAGYNVYRRSAQERSNGKPIHTAAATEKSWLDSTAKFGQDYIYSVTSLSVLQPPIESAIASEHEVHYVDRFAPPPPTELVALTEAGRARLVWRASEADDVAGYIVYRREGETGKLERLTDKPVESTEFLDTAVGSGKIYVYRVTAIDQAGNESGPSNEVRAAVP